MRCVQTAKQIHEKLVRVLRIWYGPCCASTPSTPLVSFLAQWIFALCYKVQQSPPPNALSFPLWNAVRQGHRAFNHVAPLGCGLPCTVPCCSWPCSDSPASTDKEAESGVADALSSGEVRRRCATEWWRGAHPWAPCSCVASVLLSPGLPRCIMDCAVTGVHESEPVGALSPFPTECPVVRSSSGAVWCVPCWG